MKKFLSNTLVFIQLISFFIMSIIFITLKISFMYTFYKYFYEKTNLSWHLNISNTQLLKHIENLLSYLKTASPLDTTWYTNKDILHMSDVRNLYQISLNLVYILLFVFIISSILIVITKRKNSLFFILKSFNKIFILFTILLLSLSIYIAIDFYSFWINFHLLIFDNDLWLLNPSESNLIKMFPEKLFFLLVSIIVATILIYFFLLLFLIKILKNKQ
ncbi:MULTISPECIES: DUF1461 domain-containing protein [unclassified Gemella]|uniref:lipoprotein intramolecular transacylase Lit n=1 Tax=unclassified Gemella TaxID=2624949 RepID=UPI0010738A13|nr:DUF1461 domain-containing protein [Gemella sp. GL1.1]MBF0746941.1 DUF1461 domain-containing protein [Gemella sp. 19428wG2_WT2a]NYS26984.1 DUF1461 domain-containing protein [Gemella sp. GL1]TFU59167.1 DUF1461 domain-containing protein [Gemella sp. WT2a]